MIDSYATASMLYSWGWRPPTDGSGTSISSVASHGFGRGRSGWSPFENLLAGKFHRHVSPPNVSDAQY
jgi:hypothetical protein